MTKSIADQIDALQRMTTSELVERYEELQGCPCRTRHLAYLIRKIAWRIGEHDGFYLINRRIKATFEHPFLVRRDEEWGFCSAELLRVGDYLITVADGQLDEERVDALERIDGPVRTVAILVPRTNTYLADGVWTHNDAPTQSSRGTAAFSDSGGGGTGPSISVLSSASSSSSSSGSKSSGSSFSASLSESGFTNTVGK